MLKQVLPFWEQLSPAEQQMLLDNIIRQKYASGQFLYYGGGECAGLEIINQGQVRVFLNSPHGAEITLYRLLPGQLCILSAACMIKNLNLEIHLEFEQDSEIFIIPRSIFESLSERRAEVKDFVLELVSARFSDVMWLMNQLVFSNMGERLAHNLLERSRISNSDTISITHDAIARDLGTAREVVTRLLNQFQLDGLVALSRGSIRIVDADKLNSM